MRDRGRMRVDDICAGLCWKTEIAYLRLEVMNDVFPAALGQVPLGRYLYTTDATIYSVSLGGSPLMPQAVRRSGSGWLRLSGDISHGPERPPSDSISVDKPRPLFAGR